MKIIAYHRVSTKEQGISGLGLESQRDAIRMYAASVGATILGEYTDVESGRKRERKNLRLAINHAASEGATLVVKKLDRLSRGGHVILSDLEEKKVVFIESDSPYDNPLVKEIKLSIARDEVNKVSERTSAALQIIRKRIKADGQHLAKSGRVITSLGSPQNLTRHAVESSVAVRRRQAAEHPDNKKATAFIVALSEAKKSYYAITNSLNAAGFVTSKGNPFSQVQVKNLHERFLKNMNL